jgi:hypothetical protein
LSAAIDLYLSHFRSSDSLAIALIPFATKATVAAAVEKTLQIDDKLPENVDWMVQAIAAGRCKKMVRVFEAAAHSSCQAAIYLEQRGKRRRKVVQSYWAKSTGRCEG